MEQRYELMGASREERHRRMRRVTKMFHHAYFHWCKVVASAGQGRAAGAAGGGWHAPPSNKAVHTHTHTRTHTSRLPQPSF